MFPFSSPNSSLLQTSAMAVSQSPTSINLTWTQPEGEVVDSYEVSFSYQGPCSGFNHTNTTTVDGTTRQYTLTGLQEFSNYTVTLVAVNGAGRSGGEQCECCNHGRWYVGVWVKINIFIITYFGLFQDPQNR